MKGKNEFRQNYIYSNSNAYGHDNAQKGSSVD